MPKDLLQSSLRPILVNLAQTRSLTMPLLQGLARLLELLSNWFNVTLGAKLLDHLKKWLEPEKLAQSQKSWKAGDEPKIAAGETYFYHILICSSIHLFLQIGYYVWKELHVRHHPTFMNHIYCTIIGYKTSQDL
jgi:hypothetical protein